MNDSQESHSQLVPKRIAFETLGCRSNFADTVDLQAMLVERGMVPCSDVKDADVFVLNTCTVTDDADKTAYRLLRRVRRLSPRSRIVVTGCLAEVGKTDLEASGIVDAVIGPGRKNEVLRAIINESGAQSDVELADVESADDVLADEPSPIPIIDQLSHRKQKRNLPIHRSISLRGEISTQLRGPGTFLGEIRSRARYHLRVQEGCENSCTFCIIPRTRGQLSSRPVASVIADLDRLYRVGYREVVITGTHLGGYGQDIGSSLTELLKAILAESPLRRIRLSSIDPNDVSRELIELLASDPLFCPHLHICVQAFADEILKRMNRRYRLAEAVSLVKYAADKIPGICLGSDLLTGFPGETREQVEEGIELYTSLPFAYLHVFPYSEREGTAAPRLNGAVEPAERRRRTARWRAISQRTRRAFVEGLTGKMVELLVESEDDNFVFGTSREYAALKLAKTALGQRKCVFGETLLVRGVSFDSSDERLRCAL